MLPSIHGGRRCSSKSPIDLVAVPPVYLERWMAALRPIRSQLRETLLTIYRDRDTKGEPVERTLATNILADYVSDQPGELANLLMDADEKQFGVLFPKIREAGENAAKTLLNEIAIQLQPRWTESALNPSWNKPGTAVKSRIESAHGILAGRFALCQTMPLSEFIQAAEELRPLGYRPTRFRPYGVAASVRVAAIWIRDGRDWQMSHGRSAVEIHKYDLELRNRGFQPIDVAGYSVDGKDVYAALWLKVPTDSLPAELVVGLEKKQPWNTIDSVRKLGYLLNTYTQMVSTDGQTRMCAIWTKLPGQNVPPQHIYAGLEAGYSGENHFGELEVDVRLSKAPPFPSTEGEVYAATPGVRAGTARQAGRC